MEEVKRQILSCQDNQGQNKAIGHKGSEKKKKAGIQQADKHPYRGHEERSEGKIAFIARFQRNP
jgi:hypothetical protein